MGLKKTVCLTASHSHHLCTNDCMPAALQTASPWDTMPGVGPVVGLEVGTALNTQLSFLPRCPARPSIVTMGKGGASRLCPQLGWRALAKPVRKN